MASNDTAGPMPGEPSRLELPDGHSIAYHASPGKSPGIVFLGGFMSDMTGTKASTLESWCRARGRAYLRFDYRGHGASSGRFAEGTIGRWMEDALAVLDSLTAGPHILVGSSMGAWLMLLVALARRERVCGLVGIAAAPDFTEDLLWGAFDEETREKLEREGVVSWPSNYSDEPYTITRELIEEGRRHLLLRGAISLDCPVHLLHGLRDESVSSETALKLSAALASDDVTVTLIKDGDHRLSSEADLARLCHAVEAMAERCGPRAPTPSRPEPRRRQSNPIK